MALELVKQAFVIAMLTLIVAVMVFLAVDESDSSVEVMVVTLGNGLFTDEVPVLLQPPKRLCDWVSLPF